MDFITAMNLIANAPAGPGAKAVVRSSQPGWIHYYDASLFLGRVPFGFRLTDSLEKVGNSYSPSLEDINATDWEEIAT